MFIFDGLQYMKKTYGEIQWFFVGKDDRFNGLCEGTKWENVKDFLREPVQMDYLGSQIKKLWFICGLFFFVKPDEESRCFISEGTR